MKFVTLKKANVPIKRSKKVIPWEDQGKDGWGMPYLKQQDGWGRHLKQDHSWSVPEYQRRAVELMVRQVLRVKAGIYADGIVDVIGSFVGGRLKGRAASGWFIGLSGWGPNPYRIASD